MLNDGDVFMGVLNLVSIPGHTDDSAAIHDLYKNSAKIPPVKVRVITCARESLKK